MKAPGTVRYTTNLIRTLRMEEKKDEQRERLTRILATGSAVLLLMAILYSAVNIWSMQNVLKVENENLQRLKAEFTKHTASRETIDKNDVETLSQLQLSSIFWSRQLAALGQHLPEGYWLKAISFQGTDLRVSGFANTNSSQDELVELQRYLLDLGQDSTFKKQFSNIRLASATRNEDEGRLSFEFTAENATKKPR